MAGSVQQAERRNAGVAMSRILKLAFIVLVLLVGLAFHLRNDHTVGLDYYLGVINLPFSLYVIAALCLGAILGVASVLPRYLWLKRENARLQRRIGVTEKELDNLRVIPVRDNH
jgi:putative membrane protein